MSTGGSRSRQERTNQVKTPAGGQKVLRGASIGEAGKISPNRSKRGRDNGKVGS